MDNKIWYCILQRILDLGMINVCGGTKLKLGKSWIIVESDQVRSDIPAFSGLTCYCVSSWALEKKSGAINPRIRES